MRTQENLDSEISFKVRGLERSKVSLKQLLREEEDLISEKNKIKKEINEKNNLLEKKKKQEQELSDKFQKLIEEREGLQKKIRDCEIEISKKQNTSYNFEQEMNNYKIDLAKVNAEIENLETEILEFPDVEIIKMSRDNLVERLSKSQELSLHWLC
jgi:chromosome segregation ATPase